MEMTFDEWMKFGIEKGWAGPPVCSTHDGIPESEDEENMWSEGEDPCIHIVRLYADEDEKKAIEENHSPSQWRNNYTK
jgi:hypothetical protein